MASVTLNTTAAQDARIIAAFTKQLRRPATAADVKEFLIKSLADYVYMTEHRAAVEAATASVAPIKAT